jgi:hypothetical protein
MTDRDIIRLDLAVTRESVQAIKATRRILFCLCIYHYWYQINHQQIVAPAAYLEAPEVSIPASAVLLQSFGANSANNFSKRGSLRSGSQYGSSFNWP